MPDNPLQPVVAQWVEKIRLAWDFKKKQFQDDADEAMAFFNGPYDFLYGIGKSTTAAGKAFAWTGDEDPRPKFAMTVNKVAEMVELFGPVLYHRNPVRQVNPRQFPDVPPELVFAGMMNPMDPMGQFQAQQQAQTAVMQQQFGRQIDQARALLLESYLNYTPTALNLKEQARAAIDEAIIKGMGCLWTELYQPKGGQMRLVGSFYDTVDNVLIDPDMESLEHAHWVARRCVHPVWQVEREYGLPPGSLRGNLESSAQQSATNTDPDGDYDRRRGLTNDLLSYWKVFSKMGVGARLKGVPPDLQPVLDQLGDYCYLVIAKEYPYPLNLPPDVLQAGNLQDVMARVQWPTPFWADDAWPFTPLVFHPVPRQVWPVSHVKPGMGELKFINWCFSFLTGKIRTACRDFIAVPKSLSEELKTAILSGQDLTLLEIERVHGETIQQIVSFLQHPPFHQDIYTILEKVMEMFEKRVGLTELMYGQTAVQLRSASEAQLKSDQLRIRPDDMSNKVEDAMTDVARLEALAARWHLQPPDVAPVLGQYGAQAWGTLVAPSDPSALLHQLEYRIEAGSARKPNKARDADNANQAMQTLFQPLWQYAMQTGQVGPVNALITAWAKAMDMDASPFLIQPPPPPVAPAPAGGEPPPAEQGAM